MLGRQFCFSLDLGGANLKSGLVSLADVDSALGGLRSILTPTLKRPLSEGITLRTQGVFNLDSLRRMSSRLLLAAIEDQGRLLKGGHAAGDVPIRPGLEDGPPVPLPSKVNEASLPCRQRSDHHMRPPRVTTGTTIPVLK